MIRKTERIPVMFDKDLVEKIDEFSFSQKIRSRSETIRRLVSSALEAKTETKKPDVTA